MVLDALIAKGWDVTVVEAYRTLPVEITEAHVAILREAQIIVLTSSSTATVTANALAIGRDIEDVKAQEGPRRHQLTPPIVSMGVATTATAFDRGMPITITADPSTLDGLINACVTVAQSVYPRQP